MPAGLQDPAVVRQCGGAGQVEAQAPETGWLPPLFPAVPALVLEAPPADFPGDAPALTLCHHVGQQG